LRLQVSPCEILALILTCLIQASNHAEGIVREESFVIQCDAHQLSCGGGAHLSAMTMFVPDISKLSLIC
jgi:hypothetical protein